MMELNEKIQELRKAKGMTQEELAQVLHVSRTAVSKWESGRGYPSIDSLKAIAAFFSVTIDDLLSCNEILTVAEEDQKQKESQSGDLMFGLLDLSAALLFLLPLFGHRTEGTVRTASLLALSGTALYLRTAYLTAVTGMIVSGVLTLAMQSCENAFWLKNKRRFSLLLNAAGTLLFVISPQPYAAVLLFAILTIKVLMLLKRP